LPKQIQPPVAWNKIEKLARLLKFSQQQNLYRQMHSHWLTPSSLVRDSHEPRLESWEMPKALEHAPMLEQLMYLDIVNYLTDDILTKVDRATMGASLEAREPLLDYRLVEFSFSLPLNMKWRDGRGKWALRKILNKYVPEKIIDRPKMGFSVPLGDWLRGPLRDWAETLLNSEKIEREEILQAEPIRNTWKNFCAGKNGQQALIWDVLVFQSWLTSERAKNSIP
jgi:asparagine synthase (glutamine-hydrolysing)